MRHAIWSVLGIVLGIESQASALIRVDESKSLIQFIAQLNYYGPALTAEIATAATDEIRRMWNEPQAKVTFRGRKYQTEFVITQTLHETANIPRSNCAHNFIEVMNLQVAGDRSFYYLFGQNGRFYTSDELGVSTTAAHEFGHGLGLEHNSNDQRSATVPGIMFARGTWVKSQFQWDPRARAGEPGGSVKPHFRKVRAADVQSLKIQNIQLNDQGLGCLGDGGPGKKRIVD